MKKRNLKSLREKEYRKIKERYDTLYVKSYRREKIELDEPIRHGYYLEYVIKDQYLDSKIYYKLVLLLDKQHLAWCRDKSFKVKNYRGVYEDLSPKLKTLTENEYELLDDSMKSFYQSITRVSQYSNHRYVYYEVSSSVIKKYFSYKRSKAYITHRYLVDSEVESELSYLLNRLETTYYKEYFNKGWYSRYETKLEIKSIRCKERKFRFDLLKRGIIDDDVCYN